MSDEPFYKLVNRAVEKVLNKKKSYDDDCPQPKDFWYVDHEGQMNFVTLYPDEIDGTYETDVFEYDGYEYGELNKIIDKRDADSPTSNSPPQKKKIKFKIVNTN